MGALSKGCRSCKRKKIGCDETHPRCTRCSTAGIECPGFESTLRLRFVDEGPRIRRSIAVSQRKVQGFSTIASTSPSSFLSSRIYQSQLLGHSPFLENMLTLTAFKDDIFISYLLAKMFEKEHCPSSTTAEIRCGLPADWISDLVATPHKQRSKSWDALAAIVFGHAHKNLDAIKDAHWLYGQALTELRRELSHPTRSTLLSMTALSKYEMLVSKTEKGWMSHAEGLGWLMKQRGPWKQKSYAGKSIFLEHRLMLITKSIISRQGTFLCNPIWKTVPWEDNPTSKSAIDYLVDIGADIAEYIAQINIYDNGRKINYSCLRTQIATSLKELNSWWRHWEADNTHSAIEIFSHPNNTPLTFPAILKYDRLDTAFAVCIYDAMRILLLQLWHIVQDFPYPIEAIQQSILLDSSNETALLGITSDIKGLASEILRSLECCYVEFPRFICTVSFLFIQDVAYSCFDQGSKEAIWVAEHGWAEHANPGHIEETNLLKRILPFGQIKVR